MKEKLYFSPSASTCYDGGVVLDDAELDHVAFGPGPDLKLGDGDLVGVLVQAQHDRVHSVRGQGGDGVRVHLVVHLKKLKNKTKYSVLEDCLKIA